MLTATIQLFLLNSIARRQRTVSSWDATDGRAFTTWASISVSYALLARSKPRWYHLRPSRLHRIYRLRLEREGDRVRLITRGGYNWADRYPWIVETALKNRHQQFVINGEAVVLDGDGIAQILPSSEENGEPVSPLWPMSLCDRLGPVFQAPLFRLDGILGRA